MAADTQIAALVNGIYAYPGDARIQWDHLEEPAEDDGICWGLKRMFPAGGAVYDVIVLRGSTTVEDWFRDACTLANPFDHSGLGPVHPGFLAGMHVAWARMRQLVGPYVIVAGHSLGAGRAAILTGLMVLDKQPPVRRVAFGEPRPGFAQLATLISKVPARSYRNGNAYHHDLVTDVPFTLPAEDYVHPCPLTDVCAPPGSDVIKSWGPFAWHSMPLYLQALQEGTK